MSITKTIYFPVQGQSPIVLHDVPQSITVENIIGDRGANEVWVDTKDIEDFTATITTLDEYSTGVPHKVVKRVDTLNTTSKEWVEGTRETYEASEKTFNLNYKGHERDFEVKVLEGEGGEEGGGSEELVYFTVSDSLGTYYALAVEAPPTDEGILSAPVGGAVFYIGSTSDIIGGSGSISVMSSIDFKEFYPDASDLEGDYFALCLIENWASHECYYMTTEGTLDTSLPIVPVSSSNSGSSSPKVQIRYRWGMNDAHDLTVEKNITITDYPASLEVDAHYEDNFGGHEIGDYTFNSAKVIMKSGIVEDIDEDDLTIPESATTWADKDGWQSQTWSYTKNGRTATAQVGANITALRDVKIEAELVIPYTAFPPHWGPEDGKDYWCGLKNEDDTAPILIFREGATVSKSNLLVTMTRNDGSTYETTDYWMPDNYALGRNKQSITVQKGPLSTTLPVTVAYFTKAEVGNASGSTFTKSSFYEYGEYVEPDHYKAYYECYDGTEGFEEVCEFDTLKVVPNGPIYIPVESETHNIYKLNVEMYPESFYMGHLNGCALVSKDNPTFYLVAFTGETFKNRLNENVSMDPSLIEDNSLYISTYDYYTYGYGGMLLEGDIYWSIANNSGDPIYVDNDSLISEVICKDRRIVLPENYWNVEEGVESSNTIGEYGSKVGTLTLGSKKYLYRAGLEPIDEENYLFTKNFKGKLFDYGLAKSYEPELQVEPEGGEEGNPIAVFLGGEMFDWTVWAIKKEYVGEDEEGNHYILAGMKDEHTPSTDPYFTAMCSGCPGVTEGCYDEAPREFITFLSKHPDYEGFCCNSTYLYIFDPTTRECLGLFGEEWEFEPVDVDLEFNDPLIAISYNSSRDSSFVIAKSEYKGTEAYDVPDFLISSRPVGEDAHTAHAMGCTDCSSYRDWHICPYSNSVEFNSIIRSMPEGYDGACTPGKPVTLYNYDTGEEIATSTPIYEV